MMKQDLFLSLLVSVILCLFTSPGQAQFLRGKIVRNEEAVDGLSLKKKHQKFRSVSHSEGQFFIKGKEGDQLFIRQQDTIWQVIASQNMVVDLAELDNLSIIDQKKAKIAEGLPNNWGDTLGAVTQLDHTVFNEGNIFDLYGFITGRVPGLTASHPGGDPLAQYDVQIRGLHSFGSWDYNQPVFDNFQYDPRESAIDRSRPLLVIDGMPGASPLSIDPASIASIRVLRDAASASAYGLRAANGVIEIETKLGDTKPLSVTYNTYLAQDKPVNLPEVLSAGEYSRLVNTPNTIYHRPENDLGNNTDWQEAITRTAWSHAHHLGIGGTLHRTSYRLSFNYRDQQGIAKRSGFGQWNTQLRIQQQLWKDRLSLGINAGHTKRKFQEPRPLIFNQSSSYNPTAPVYSDTTGQYGDYSQQVYFDHYNPVAMLEQTTREGSNEVNTLGGNVSLTPLPGLVISGQYHFQRSNDLLGIHYPRNALYKGISRGGLAQRDERKLDNQFGELALSYQQKWRRHHLRFDGGYAYQQWDYTNQRIEASYFSNYDFTYDQTAGAGMLETASLRTRDKQPAFFGHLAYSWNDTWFLKAGLRREGASRMGPENKWAWFPAVQGAFSLHNLLNWKNRFHFRIGYGETGQLPPKNFAAHWKLQQGGYLYYSGQYIPSYDFVNTPNPAIGEERRSEWNVGLDLGIFHNRLTLSANWYHSQSRKIVAETSLPVPPNTQYLFFDNFGALQNQGLELELSYQSPGNSRLRWNSTLSVFTNTTRLIDMNHPEASFFLEFTRVGRAGAPGCCPLGVQQLEEGKPIGSFFGPVYLGIDEGGQWLFADSDNNGYHDWPDFRTIGNAQPDWQLGWHHSLELGRFDLSLLLRGVFGHQALNVPGLYYGIPALLGPYNVLKSAFEGEHSRLQDYPLLSSYFIENASFLRLEFITLGYEIPFPSNSAISGLRLYLTAQQLFTISGYSGPDPSLWLENLGNPLIPGIAVPNRYEMRGQYFPNRTIMFGVRLQL